jgi:hypothetical protein
MLKKSLLENARNNEVNLNNCKPEHNHSELLYRVILK